MPWRNYVDDVELKICEQKADCRQMVNVAKNGGLYYYAIYKSYDDVYWSYYKLPVHFYAE